MSPLTHVKRRDGEIIPFDRTRIEKAIDLACEAVGELEKDFISRMTDDIVNDLALVSGEETHTHIHSVEEIQDLVEKHLMKEGRYEIAKAYILYREKQSEKREERKEKLIEQFEKHSMQVIKADGAKELFDLKKIKAVFDRAATGYEKECSFEDLIEAFKKNIVNEIKTSDINKLLVKTCIDLVTVENINWQEIAGRISLFNLYKEASRNRSLKYEDIYTPQAVLNLFHDYIERGLYAKELRENYTDEEILEAAKSINAKLDLSYTYTTILSLNKRYLLNPNKVVSDCFWLYRKRKRRVSPRR
jgi:ribonucleoside-diphosphate reductase alpha chain